MLYNNIRLKVGNKLGYKIMICLSVVWDNITGLISLQ